MNPQAVTTEQLAQQLQEAKTALANIANAGVLGPLKYCDIMRITMYARQAYRKLT